MNTTKLMNLDLSHIAFNFGVFQPQIVNKDKSFHG